MQNKESQRQGIVEPELIQSDDSNFINKKFRKRANSFKKELKSFEEISWKVQKSLGPPYDKLGLVYNHENSFIDFILWKILNLYFFN